MGSISSGAIAVPTATSRVNVSELLSGLVPQQSVRVSQEAALSQALREQMVQLGIYARPPTADANPTLPVNSAPEIARSLIDTTLITNGVINPNAMGSISSGAIAVPTATSRVNVSELLSGLVPQQSVHISQEAALSQALREQMVQLGIYARPPTTEESHAKLLGPVVYQQIITEEGADPDKYEVADARLSEGAVKEALRIYTQLFFAPAAQGGQTSRAQEIQQAISEAYRQYAATGGTADATGFLAYLERADADAVSTTAIGYVRQIGALFHEVGQLGLTDKEVDISKTVLLRPLRVPGLPARELRQVIEQASTQAPAPAGKSMAALANPAGAPIQG
jgi:hypothetical protein